MASNPFLMGAVAYDPKVVTIWNGFRAWLVARGLPFDYLLYSNYERQVEDLLAGHIHAAWNSPLAWVRARRLADASGVAVRPLVMRDTDCDLTSVVVVRAGAGITAPEQLRGRVVGVGAVDSPQATLLPLAHLHALGLHAGRDVQVRRFDVGVGLHGDHVGGERDAARALVRGEVDAACLIDGNHLQFTQEGILPPGATRVLAQTGTYDHCNMTIGPAAPPALADQFGELLGAMDYADAEVRPLLDLEGLHAWRQGRTSGYRNLEAAVDLFHFYAADGRVDADDYRP